MFISSGSVNVTTTATLLASAKQSRDSILIQNNSSSIPLYFGTDEDVTAIGGGVIPVGQSFSDSGASCYKGAWYGITESSTVDARVTEAYLIKIGGAPL